MATWNGSYPEDLNCLMYDDRNAADVPTTAGNWSYFVENNAYLGDIPHVSTGGYYPRARGDRQVYEQSGPTTAYYQDDCQNPSNMVPLKNNAYQERVLPDTLFSDNAGASNGGISTSHNAPSFSRSGYRPRFRGNRMAGKHAPSSAGDVVQSTVVENSNLHPIANEFVPNNQGRFRKDNRFKKYDNGNPSGFNTQEFRPKSASSDNKGERRYDNRRNANYRQKKPQNMQTSSRFCYRDTPRTQYNARNYNKFQNSKYYNKKYQSNVPPTGQNAAREARTTITEAVNSAMSNSQENKTFGEDVQEDDSFSSTKIDRSREEMHEDNDSENMFSRNQEAPRNGRVKRFASASNYHRYNSNDMQSESGTSRKTTTAKYTQRRNNEMINYKEKKMANWRDKTESNETVHASQGKNYKKKYDIGIFIQFIKKITLLLYKKELYNEIIITLYSY